MPIIPQSPRRARSYADDRARAQADAAQARRVNPAPRPPKTIVVYVQAFEPPATAPTGTLWLDTSGDPA